MPKNGWWTIDDVAEWASFVYEVKQPAFLLLDKKPINDPKFIDSIGGVTRSASLKTYVIKSTSELKKLVLGAYVYMYGLEDEMFSNLGYTNTDMYPRLRAYIERDEA